MWRYFKGKSPVIEKLISHPEFRKREDGEIENDVIIIRTSPHIFGRDEPNVPICLPIKKVRKLRTFKEPVIKLYSKHTGSNPAYADIT
jgi:hypothetical protein